MKPPRKGRLFGFSVFVDLLHPFNFGLIYPLARTMTRAYNIHLTPYGRGRIRGPKRDAGRIVNP
jgi:hypothetical protein